MKTSLFYPMVRRTSNSWQNLQLGGGWGRWTLGGGAGLATAGCLGPVFDATFMVVVVKVEGEAGGATRIAKDKITPASSMNTLFHEQVRQATHGLDAVMSFSHLPPQSQRSSSDGKPSPHRQCDAAPELQGYRGRIHREIYDTHTQTVMVGAISKVAPTNIHVCT